MKINILFDFKNGSWGGANQFLKALRNDLIKKNISTDDINESDVVIANSYHKINTLILFLLKKHDVFFIHRLGPLFFYHRGILWKLYDIFIIRFANTFADGIVFQSHWSYNEALRLGLEKRLKHAIIYNAPDNTIFTDTPKKNHSSEEKFRIIASSNSNNWEKGFRYFQFLDKHLDFTRYEMDFVGKSPVQFRNIRHIEPQDSMRLAAILRDGDLYVSPVRNEACSNAILEALACGLPVLALNDSSNPEIVGSAGELFDDENDLLEKIERIHSQHQKYRENIVKPNIETITNEYTDFIKNICAENPRKRSKIILLVYGVYHWIVRILIILIEKCIPQKKSTPAV